MSSNGSIASNTTNTTEVYSYSYQLPDIFYIYSGVSIFFIVVGTLLNLWFLVAILTSQDTRSRLRNKIICNSLVLHLIDSVIVLPLYVWIVLVEYFSSCLLYSTLSHFAFIQDFIGNWLLVMLLVVFIAQIQDFNPKMKLSPRAVTLGTAGLLVFPWAASLVLVPVIAYDYHRRSYYPRDCVFVTWNAIEVFRSVDTAAPIFFIALLLIVAVLLRYRRFTRGYSSSSMQVDLISRGPEIDNSIAYIVATGVCMFCDLFQMIYVLNVRTFSQYKENTWITMQVVSVMMSDSRAILMPLPWLLLPDIRQRIITWRPWYRPAPGIDLTVTYRKEES